MTAPKSQKNLCPHAHQDLRSTTDALRPHQRLVTNAEGHYVLLRHADVLAAALDDKRFSSQVSRFLQIPNGLDNGDHELYRPLIDKYLSREALLPFIPVFSQVALELMSALPKETPLDAVNDIGAVFAVRAQCAWLGWPATLEPKLLQWMRQNHAATRSQDEAKTTQVAEDFDDIIRSVLKPRSESLASSTAQNVTQQLCQEHIQGRPLTEAELVSILRNWTGGDLGSMALCVGVIVAYLVKNPHTAQTLSAATDNEVDAIIDEILRLDDPFVSNRRVTRCPVSLGNQQLPEGARVLLNWTSANRDESVFGDNTFSPVANAAQNLVYGAGKHVCPGRLLATWQLRIATQALLANVTDIRLAPDQALVRERPPLGGYSRVAVILS